MAANASTPPAGPRVFISYARESPEHIEQVRALGTLLRTRFAIDAHMDSWYEDTRRDWSQWATRQVDDAAYVLAIASPAFRARADGRTPVDEGRGVRFEGALLRSRLTHDQDEWTRRILPVVLPGYSVDDIPRFLMPYSGSHYIVPEITAEGVTDLVRALTGQARHPMPELGGSPTLPAASTATPARSDARGRPVVQRVNMIDNSDIGTIVMGDSYHFGEGR
jgi:hypothetical protein